MKRLRRLIAAACVVVGTGGLSVTPGNADTSSKLQEMVEASKAENGLLVYSNLPEFVWVGFRELLSQKYPWVRLETTDMGDDLWERYFAESASKTRTADLITTTAPDRFASFIDRGGVEPYVSTEIDALPKWSIPEPGLYTISASPAILMYNKHTVKTPPKSLRDIRDMVEGDPEGMKGKVSTYDASVNSFGTAMFATWLEGEGNSWEILEPIGSATRAESGGAIQREKVMTGEYNVAFFANSVSLIGLERPEVRPLVGWNYVSDGTPVSLQGAVVTRAASSPNTAKIVLDLMLSKEGQIALAKVGLTPYREDVPQEGLPFNTLNTVADIVGVENLIFYSYDRAKVADWPEVVKTWISYFKN